MPLTSRRNPQMRSISCARRSIKSFKRASTCSTAPSAAASRQRCLSGFFDNRGGILVKYATTKVRPNRSGTVTPCMFPDNEQGGTASSKVANNPDGLISKESRKKQNFLASYFILRFPIRGGPLDLQSLLFIPGIFPVTDSCVSCKGNEAVGRICMDSSISKTAQKGDSSAARKVAAKQSLICAIEQELVSLTKECQRVEHDVGVARRTLAGLANMFGLPVNLRLTSRASAGSLRVKRSTAATAKRPRPPSSK